MIVHYYNKRKKDLFNFLCTDKFTAGTPHRIFDYVKQEGNCTASPLRATCSDCIYKLIQKHSRELELLKSRAEKFKFSAENAI